MRYTSKTDFVITDEDNHQSYTVAEDSDGYGCVAISGGDSPIWLPPEMAILLGEAIIKMAKIMLKKNPKD